MTASDALNLGLLATALVTAILGIVPLALAAVRVLKGKQSTQDLELLRRAAMDAVRAVEQTMTKKATSEEKLAAAVEVAARSLAIYGVKVDQVRLRMAIENAVFLITAGLELPPPPATDPAAIPAP